MSVTFDDAVNGLCELAVDLGLEPPPPSKFEPDVWVRGPGHGKGLTNSAAAYLVEQGRFHDWVGKVHDHSSGLNGFWKPETKSDRSPVQRQQQREQFQQRQQRAQCARQQSQAEVAKIAQRVIQSSQPVSTTNPYIQAKQLTEVPLLCIRESKRGAVQVPMLDIFGAIWNYESIYWNSETKRYAKNGLKGGRRDGLGIQFGDGGGYRVFAEGVADALSVWHATGLATICCFSAGNVPKVAQAHRAATTAQFLFAADHDDAGIKAAQSAAQAVRGEVIVPGNQGEDFNDIWCQGGEGAVRAYFEPWLKRNGG